MSYCTFFSMRIKDDTPEQREKIMERLREEDIIGSVMDEDLSCADWASWYDEMEDMKAISADFPNVHFIVHGEGMDRDDIWDHHYLGGKVQVCTAEISIPPFDPAQLK